jgi:nicotinamidase-related amidase
MEESNGHTAVLTIDMVGDMFARAELAAQQAPLAEAINRLTAAARHAGFPVFWVRQEFASDLSDAPLMYRRRDIRSTIVGTAGAELLPELHLGSTDRMIVKKRYSAFFGTDLEEQLRREHVVRLLIAGVNTHACIRTTAVDAYQRDYEVAIVRDCVGSYDREHHDVSLRYMDERIGRVISLHDLLGQLDQFPSASRSAPRGSPLDSAA